MNFYLLEQGGNQGKGHRAMTDQIQPVNAALATKTLGTETLPFAKKREDSFNYPIVY